MKRPNSLHALFFAVAFLCCSFGSSATAQFQNGGFETGDFTFYTVNDPSLFTNVGNDPLLAHSGTFHANLGATPNVGILSQTFTTLAGSSYNLSFWLANDSNGTVNSFDVFWNGVSVYSSLNSAVFGYTNITVNNLLAPTASTTLQFRYRHDDDFFRLDDVAVSIVPEPSTVGLMLSAFAGLGLVQYRRTKARRLAGQA